MEREYRLLFNKQSILEISYIILNIMEKNLRISGEKFKYQKFTLNVCEPKQNRMF